MILFLVYLYCISDMIFFFFVSDFCVSILWTKSSSAGQHHSFTHHHLRLKSTFLQVLTVNCPENRHLCYFCELRLKLFFYLTMKWFNYQKLKLELIWRLYGTRVTLIPEIQVLGDGLLSNIRNCWEWLFL